MKRNIAVSVVTMAACLVGAGGADAHWRQPANTLPVKHMTHGAVVRLVRTYEAAWNQVPLAAVHPVVCKYESATFADCTARIWIKQDKGSQYAKHGGLIWRDRVRFMRGDELSLNVSYHQGNANPMMWADFS